jgi:hypothetical protein
MGGTTRDNRLRIGQPQGESKTKGLLVARAAALTILCRLNRFVPMPLGRRREPFDHPD